jgi:hypothetical protein
MVEVLPWKAGTYSEQNLTSQPKARSRFSEKKQALLDNSEPIHLRDNLKQTTPAVEEPAKAS